MQTPAKAIKTLMALGCATALAGCLGSAVSDDVGLSALTKPLDDLTLAVVDRDWPATDTALRNVLATHDAALGGPR